MVQEPHTEPSASVCAIRKILKSGFNRIFFVPFPTKYSVITGFRKTQTPPYLSGMDLRQRFLHHLAPTTFSPLALEFVRAEGVYLFDPQGKPHMDLISGIGVANLGHSHPEIVAAVQQQAAQHMHLMVYGEYAQLPQVAYAEALLAALPDPIDQIYWGNSGAEAVDGALKLAKRATGRTEILSFHGSYHGSTTGPLSAMGNECMKSAYRPLVPGHRILPFNGTEVLDAIGPHTAAVLVEAIQSESGYIPADSKWLRQLEARCRAAGGGDRLAPLPSARSADGRGGAARQRGDGEGNGAGGRERSNGSGGETPIASRTDHSPSRRHMPPPSRALRRAPPPPSGPRSRRPTRARRRARPARSPA